jgi:DNA repair protein RecO (recombination protein O)
METDAIVLDCYDYGESDLIVTLFSRAQGRLTAIAKGAKKSKRRFVNKLELFSFLHILYDVKPGRNLAFLEDADLHTSFINLRQRVDLYTAASIIREALLVATKEDEADEQIFRLSLWALHQCNLFQQPRLTITLFLIRLLAYLGYRPNMENCHRCEKLADPTGKYWFQPSYGGLVCSTCNNLDASCVLLSLGTIRALRSVQDMPIDRLHRVKIAGSMLDEASFTLYSYFKHLFQRDFVSWQFFKNLPE